MFNFLANKKLGNSCIQIKNIYQILKRTFDDDSRRGEKVIDYSNGSG